MDLPEQFRWGEHLGRPTLYYRHHRLADYQDGGDCWVVCIGLRRMAHALRKRELPSLEEAIRYIDSCACRWKAELREEATGAAVGGRPMADTHTGPAAATYDRPMATDIERLGARKDGAYDERMNLVAALARMFPSGIRDTTDPGWTPSWKGCVYIDLPTDQIAYHYHTRHVALIEGLPPYTKPWDGHGKDTAHARLGALWNRDDP